MDVWVAVEGITPVFEERLFLQDIHFIDNNDQFAKKGIKVAFLTSRQINRLKPLLFLLTTVKFFLLAGVRIVAVIAAEAHV